MAQSCTFLHTEISAHRKRVLITITDWGHRGFDLLPAPTHWLRDGGPYIGTSDAVITQDPETGLINTGTYRNMVQGKARVGFYISPGKDSLLDRQKWWERGEPCPIVCC